MYCRHKFSLILPLSERGKETIQSKLAFYYWKEYFAPTWKYLLSLADFENVNDS